MESITKFMLYSLKQIPTEIINRVNNQEPDPCYACNTPILRQEFNRNLALILLPCGHVHHFKCVKALKSCPFPACFENIDNSGVNIINMQTIQQSNFTNIQAIQPPQTLQTNMQSPLAHNSRITDMKENIQVVPNQQNKYPQNFPANISQLKRLTGSGVDSFLEFYGLKKNGLVKDKRERLAEYIGVRLND
ncbi:hypothetical protein C1645_551378 [Glomus cerebriforme]|uniref:RING-type domain-containing protein n=1 Tax=Glomus cerebriforme TaxID=658196 RepID=A0A397TE03_9GLOM|nr:hypothetical protein C1645_551378 [Glomus cerebriforme]